MKIRLWAAVAALLAGGAVRAPALDLSDGDASGGGEPFRLGEVRGILSCAHLLRSGDVRVALGPGDRRISDSAFRLLPRRDLMFLPLETAPEPRPVAAPRPGEPVTAPGGGGAVLRVGPDEFEISAPFGPGDSGRGVFNARGELVGLCAALETDAGGVVRRRFALRLDGLRPEAFVELPAELPADAMAAAEIRRRIARASNRDGWTLLAGPVFPTSPRQADALTRERRALCRMFAALRLPPDRAWIPAAPALTFPADRFDELAADLESRRGPPRFRADPLPGNPYRCRLWRGAFLTALPDGRVRLAEFTVPSAR